MLRHRRKLIALAALIAVAAVLHQNWPSLRRWALYQYWFRVAMAHEMPAGVRYRIDNPATQPSIDPERYAVVGGRGNPPLAAYAPRAARELSEMDNRWLWLELFERDPIVFMGRLQRPDGRSRLVVVQGDYLNAYQLLNLTRVLVLPPPGLFEGPPPFEEQWGGVSAASGAWLPAVITQVDRDPGDPTRLIIRFSVSDFGGEPAGGGVLDARLQDDDSMRIRLREVNGRSAGRIGLATDRKSGRPSEESMRERREMIRSMRK